MMLTALLVLAPLAQEVVPVLPLPDIPPGKPVVELAICLDTSGSMDGLIENAKQKIWAIVNDLALAEPTPLLRVALLTYGNDGHDPERGWVMIRSDFTEDLDLISRELFALTTNGGTELVARVIRTSVNALAWTPGEASLKLIVVAGNESAEQDTQYAAGDMASAAIARGILVNTIYCGNPMDEIAPGWKAVALKADGQFAVIDHNQIALAIETPFDGRLGELSTAINGTYLPYGELGAQFCENQSAQDSNAASCNAWTVASRAQTKGGKLYSNAHWDLVDACKDAAFDLTKVEDKDLPEAMRAMTPEQRKAHVAAMAAKRAEIQQAIGEIGARRDAFLEQEIAKQQAEGEESLDRAVRDAIRSQAAVKGLKFPPPPAPAPEAAEAPAAESPAAASPAAEKPAAEKPAAESPAAETPVRRKSERTRPTQLRVTIRS